MYVTLPSHSSLKEFPNNQPSSFKVCLAEPLRLLGDDWQVGLASMSIPDRGLDLSHIQPLNRDLFIMSSVRKKKDNTFDYKIHRLTLNELTGFPIQDGLSFMKAVQLWYQEQFNQEFKREYESVDQDAGKHTYLKFYVDDGDLVMDNTKLIRKRFSGVNDPLPIFAFTQDFGVKMGWIRQDYKKDWEPGLNLQIVFHNQRIVTRGQYDFRNKDGTANLYMREETDNAGVTWFYLTGRCSWRFSSINRMFDRLVTHPNRSLYVYSDVGGSSMVGNRFTDLLKEVHYPRQGQGKVYYEPEHIHYLPVRREVIDIIEVNLTENTTSGEELVKFKDDHTLVTLHFKKASD